MRNGPNGLETILDHDPDAGFLWAGRYKIPWDDPEFSRRMLREHLSQDHDLASRRTGMVEAQVRWIHEQSGAPCPGRILDLGCGPGLYLRELAKLGYRGCGIDFSPASIEYARAHLPDECRLVQGDLRTVDFGSGHDAAMMIFGELNVFSPDDGRRILQKAHAALSSDGVLLLEVHRFDAVRRVGQAPNSWYKSGTGLQGLFSDRPHLCLIENRWFEGSRTALQTFYILDAATGAVETYSGTIQAWTDDEYRALLTEAGFSDVVIPGDWPVHSDDLFLIVARKR